MALDPLGAMRLADERKETAWSHFIKGIDDVGNLDTYLKDRNISTGDERPGVFGGSFWKAWTPGQASEVVQETRPPAGFDQFTPEADSETDVDTRPSAGFDQFTPGAARKPELADVHRWAKLRGLNHDQPTIDEKTQRPVREEQSRLKELELATNAEIRKQEYNQRDIDQARNFYDSSFSQARAEEGSLNVKREQARGYVDKGLAVPVDLQTEINNIQARFKHYSSLAALAKQYLEEIPEGERGYKGSSYLFTGEEQSQPQTEAGIQDNPAPASAPASNAYPAIQDFAKGHMVENKNAFDAFFPSLGLDESQKEAARRIYKEEVEFNKATKELEHDDALKAAARKKAKAEGKAADKAVADLEGATKSIKDFIGTNPPYSTANAKRLTTLIKDYNTAAPASAAKLAFDYFTGSSEAEYNQQIQNLRNIYGINQETPPNLRNIYGNNQETPPDGSKGRARYFKK